MYLQINCDRTNKNPLLIHATASPIRFPKLHRHHQTFQRIFRINPTKKKIVSSKVDKQDVMDTESYGTELVVNKFYLQSAFQRLSNPRSLEYYASIKWESQGLQYVSLSCC